MPGERLLKLQMAENYYVCVGRYVSRCGHAIERAYASNLSHRGSKKLHTKEKHILLRFLPQRKSTGEYYDIHRGRGLRALSPRKYFDKLDY